jgi:hypothetical protein
LKKRITRFPPHQNGKVFGILLGVITLLFCLPIFLVFILAPAIDEPGGDDHLRPFIFLVLPIAYLLFGYLWIALGSAVYNFLYKYIGGFEIEVKDEDT